MNTGASNGLLHYYFIRNESETRGRGITMGKGPHEFLSYEKCAPEEMRRKV